MGCGASSEAAGAGLSAVEIGILQQRTLDGLADILLASARNAPAAVADALAKARRGQLDAMLLSPEAVFEGSAAQAKALVLVRGWLGAAGGAELRADCFGRTPLMLACERAAGQAVEILLGAGAATDKRGAGGWTALHFAVAADCGGAVRALARAGADLDAGTSGGGRQPGARAAAGAGHRVAPEPGAAGGVASGSGGLVEADGTTPLLLAARRGSARAAKALIESGANYQPHPGRGAGGRGLPSPLMAAVHGRHWRVAKLLCQHPAAAKQGLDVNEPDALSAQEEEGPSAAGGAGAGRGRAGRGTIFMTAVQQLIGECAKHAPPADASGGGRPPAGNDTASGPGLRAPPEGDPSIDALIELVVAMVHRGASVVPAVDAAARARQLWLVDTIRAAAASAGTASDRDRDRDALGPGRGAAIGLSPSGREGGNSSYGRAHRFSPPSTAEGYAGSERRLRSSVSMDRLKPGGESGGTPSRQSSAGLPERVYMHGAGAGAGAGAGGAMGTSREWQWPASTGYASRNSGEPAPGGCGDTLPPLGMGDRSGGGRSHVEGGVASFEEALQASADWTAETSKRLRPIRTSSDLRKRVAAAGVGAK